MKDRKNYFQDDFFKDAEESLKEFEEIDSLLEAELETLDERTSAEMRRKFLQAEDDIADYQTDGYAELWVSDDEMKAYANFYSPGEGKTPLDPEGFEHILYSKGIEYGVDWDVVKEALFTCNTEHVPQNEIVIAEGKRPVDEVLGYFVVDESLTEGKPSITGDEQQIDFKRISPFVLVKKDHILARYREKKDGVFGMTVYGKAIPFNKQQVTQLSPGKNTRQEADVIRAACDGRFEYSEETFQVNEVLEVETDVDYQTGHIDFPGDVIIKGQIKDNFFIKAGGSVFCAKTMDASEVECGKDIIVKRGIIGRKKGSVRAGGKIKAKFIENCYVEAKDTMYLEVGTINSSLYTSNKIDMKKKGMIIGGTVCAQNGVEAAQIGTDMGPRTEIYCGIDYAVSNKLEWIKEKNIQLAFTLQKVEERMKRAPSSGKENVNNLRKKIQEAMHKLNDTASSLINKLDKNEEAEVIVSGTVFPGVYIEICHVSYIVGHKMSNVRFKLDKEKGKIVTDTLF